MKGFYIVMLFAGLCVMTTLPLVEAQWLCEVFGGGWGWIDCSYGSYYYSSSYNWESDHEGTHTGVRPHEAIYLGCFADASDRALSDASTDSYDMDPVRCFAFCWENNMRYAGLEFGTQCFCGTDGTDFGIHGEKPESECSAPCRGDYSEYCGGSWRMNVYDLRNASSSNPNDVRLINWDKRPYYSRDWYKGIVEIYRGGKWQAMCDKNWSMKEASVVCRQLGYGDAIKFYVEKYEDEVIDSGNMESVPTSYYGNMESFPGQDVPLAFGDVTCDGTELTLASCKTEPWQSSSACSSVQDVGVECKGPKTAPDSEVLHLEGGEDEYSGLVVMTYDGIEGYICDDEWDITDAAVVCHQLGYGAPIKALPGGTYRPAATRTFLLDNIECSASDKKYSRPLDKCRHGQWGNTDCVRGQEAGVRCHPPGITDVRLADGPTKHEGRLEVLHDGEWGTVCDREWDIDDADVICRMLGYPWAVSTTPSGYAYPIFYTGNTEDTQAKEDHWYGETKGPIHFTRVSCEGYETTLEDCIDTSDAYHTETWGCKHDNDVGIRCANKTDTRTFPVRLVNGREYEGRVEVQWHGMWGTVCDDDWDIKDASVVCRQLGFGDAVKATTGSSFGESPSDALILLDEVDCTGMEYFLSDCSHLGWTTHDCRHHEDAGVVCEGDGKRPDGKPGIPWGPGRPGTRPPSRRPTTVRLVGGYMDSEGRVEVSYRGQWGTVCKQGWDMNDANVVCKMLGYVGAAEDGQYRDYGRGSGDILLSDVDCNGNERNIDQCGHADWGVNTCTHEDDAAVVCIDYDDKIAIRLVDGDTKSEGHVEVLRNGVWGAICDEGWDISDAGVVCRQLGYQNALKSTQGSTFGPNDGPISVSNVYCTGEEMDLNHCSMTWDPYRCDSDDHAGVVCDDGQGRGKGDHEEMSPGAEAGIFLGVLLALVITVSVLCTIVCMRRKKKAPDTAPIIPPSHLSPSSVSFSAAAIDHSQPIPIGGAIGGILQPPPVYTPTEVKVPLGDTGVSAAASAQGAYSGHINGNANGVAPPTAGETLNKVDLN